MNKLQKIEKKLLNNNDYIDNIISKLKSDASQQNVADLSYVQANFLKETINFKRITIIAHEKTISKYSEKKELFFYLQNEGSKNAIELSEDNLKIMLGSSVKETIRNGLDFISNNQKDLIFTGDNNEFSMNIKKAYSLFCNDKKQQHKM